MEGAKWSTHGKDGRDKAAGSEKQFSPQATQAAVPRCRQLHIYSGPLLQTDLAALGKRSHLAVEALGYWTGKKAHRSFLEAEGKSSSQKGRKGDPEDAATNRCLRHSTLQHPP